MSFIERIFPNRPSNSDIKMLMDEVDKNNQLYQAILGQIMPGQHLKKDYKIKDYIADGYEKNADIFSIVDRLSTMFSQIPIRLIDGEDEIENDLSERMRQPNSYQVWQEFAKLWYTFYLVTGNAIKYAPRLSGGNDAGKLMPGGIFMMPTQHVEIVTGGWRDPVKEYIIDIDQREKIPAEHVIHTRMPNLQYQDGANFMGMSPIKVAALIIEAENQGYQMVADTMDKGIPPGVLTKVNAEYDEKNTKSQQDNLKRTWKEKYGNQKYRRTAADPVLTVGDVRWIPMGFSNFRDLQILEMNQNGLRVLCNVLGVPAVAFNDASGAQHWNMNEARKMVYTNRLIPDMGLLLAHLNNQIAPAYGTGLLEADYSEIPELQDDKKDLAVWLNMCVDKGLPPNEMFGRLGLPRIDKPELDESYLPFSMMPVGAETITDDEADKMLEEHKIDDYKGLKKVV